MRWAWVRRCYPFRAENRSVNGGCVTNVPANLFLIAAPCQVPHPHGCPSELRHQLRQKTPVRARCAAVLGHLKHVHQSLRADALALGAY
jgi:hypothetical protein